MKTKVQTEADTSQSGQDLDGLLAGFEAVSNPKISKTPANLARYPTKNWPDSVNSPCQKFLSLFKRHARSIIQWLQVATQQIQRYHLKQIHLMYMVKHLYTYIENFTNQNVILD